MTLLDLRELRPEHKIRIIIVDDDPLVLDLLGIFISSFGYEYVAAGDGLEAVEELKKGPVDIIITDLMMPNMDGMELLKYTRTHYPDTDVLVVTGHAGTFTYMDVIRAGAIDFITKPFNEDELEAKLDRALRERKIFQELEKLSLSDSLTGLYNRRQFDLKLDEETHRAHRQGYDMFLSLLDVDNFKGYNDSFGHQAGDRLLQSVGEIMPQYIRKNVDWSFRIGGDEFAIIVPQTTTDQMVVVAERIMEQYTKNDFAKTSLSIGIARFLRREGHPWEDDIVDLIERTDKALYEGKSSGRGKIILSDEG
ncbi:MAG: diguanylate cyclase [Desulfobulbaceae bacterium]|nr:diguanylate cyclase [Desulfobulbaceae bacterium]